MPFKGELKEFGFIFRGLFVKRMGGEVGFEAIGPIDVPGGEGDLAVEGAFDGASWVELETECGGHNVEGFMVVFSEQDGLFGEESKFCGVGCGAGFALGVVGPVLSYFPACRNTPQSNASEWESPPEPNAGKFASSTKRGKIFVHKPENGG